MDASLAQGLNYYRIKQVDLDGTASYLAIKVVNFQADGKAVSIYPNPAKGMLIVQAYDVSGGLSHSIVQLNGSTVLNGSLVEEAM